MASTRSNTLSSYLLAFLLLVASPLLPLTNATPTDYHWPDPQTDFLETILYQQTGFRLNTFASVLAPDNCAGPFPNGRNIGAEWLRIAYHDMATADAGAGRGGLDASIVFETLREENVGGAFAGAFLDGPGCGELDPNNEQVQTFDPSPFRFDNLVVRQFVANASTNPLVVGNNVTTRSDLRIFNADGGTLMQRLGASQAFFFNTCNSLLERMVNTVPAGVQLSEVITPIRVKPDHVFVEVNEDGTLTVSGEIRILEDGSSSANREVLIHLAPRSGAACYDAQPCPVVTAVTNAEMTGGSMYNPKVKFTFYSFSTTVAISQGVTSFSVEIVDGGNSPSRSCNTQEGLGITYHLSVAVRDDEQFDDVSMVFYDAVAPQGGSIIATQVTNTVNLTNPERFGETGYSVYNFVYPSDTLFFHHTADLVATRASRTVRVFHEISATFCSGQ